MAYALHGIITSASTIVSVRKAVDGRGCGTRAVLGGKFLVKIHVGITAPLLKQCYCRALAWVSDIASITKHA